MSKNISKQTVFVGMSGGVDSSVSAALLKNQGYEVVGVFIRTWHPDFLECNEEEERRDAMRVAAHLDIPFLTFDFEDIYKKEVGDYMIREYRAGRTPNPDVMCNKYVKFGAFLEKAISMGADFVATGHYAKTSVANAFSQVLGSPREYARPDHSKKHLPLSLYKGNDTSKDQSYFLWTLKQKQLSKILFPVGHLNKSEVRRLAKKFKLPVAEKKDSQGICFLGPVDLKQFLKHYIKEKKGKVFLAEGEARPNGEAGRVIGYHNGVTFSTLGERHGFTITKKTPNDAPYYVVAKDVKKNILYVSKNRKMENFNNFYVIEKTNWIRKIPEPNKNYTAQVRYHGEFLPCQIKIISKENAKVIFEKPVLVAKGQSVVIYDRANVVGGGIIE